MWRQEPRFFKITSPLNAVFNKNNRKMRRGQKLSRNIEIKNFEQPLRESKFRDVIEMSALVEVDQFPSNNACRVFINSM